MLVEARICFPPLRGRNKKVRCDGVEPTCGPCAKARRPTECSYVSYSFDGPKIAPVQKGAACGPCRRKKKKCDALRPFCTTCQVAGKEDECEYSDGSRGSLTRTLLQRNRELEDRLWEYEDPTTSGTHQSQERAESSSTHPTASETSVIGAVSILDYPVPSFSDYNHSGTSSAPPSSGLRRNAPAFNLAHANVAPFSLEASSLVTPDTVDPMHLSSPDGLRLFRDLFLSHELQLGCCISDTRAFMLSLGEASSSALVTSPAAVPPILVCVAQLWGSLLWQEVNLKFGLAEETEQLTQVHALLDSAPNNACDPLTTVLSHSLMSTYYFSKVNMVKGREHLTKAASVVSEHDLRLSSDSPPNVRGNGHELYTSQEMNAILSQLLYQDTVSMMLMNLPSVVGADLYAQFQSLRFQPSDFSNLDLIILRAKSVFHLHEANHLTSVWRESTGDGGMFEPTFPTHCYEWYFDLVQRISNHIAILTPILLKLSVLGGNRERVLAVKLSLAVVHAAAAELYELLASTNSTYCGKSITAALEIVQVTGTFDDSDFHFLDPILGTCWTVAARVLRRIQGMIRIGSTVPLHLEESNIRRSMSTMITASLKLERSMPT
ncbi:hypothetical protein NEOLEDRAFT_719218 [Neolentinus lepideus HHB14362 ss-1]|uniref:Zn(2)-C6 fungal-type domain-containing protein n=1 Tax=Neolentinus lepideus HHB14362 ss-1 TaxID=1314782 RepID=A0A165Q5S5_9AGAM|nr:hypothetical protein NEOLEDRAFT_719218 [Neolentinus lepideus HHB14362 ss-1]